MLQIKKAKSQMSHHKTLIHPRHRARIDASGQSQNANSCEKKNKCKRKQSHLIYTQAIKSQFRYRNYLFFRFFSSKSIRYC